MAAKSEQKSAAFYHYCEVSRCDETVEGKCKVCRVKTRGKPGITSNSVTHLKVRLVGG